MGRLKKEVVDEIRRLGAEGYTYTEIGTSLDVDRGTVRKYIVGGDSPLELEETGEPRLSDGIMKRLYDLQGILSADSVLDALETAYRDEVAAQKFKHTLWEEHAFENEKFTVEGLIQKLKEYGEEMKGELKVYMDGYPEDRKLIAELKEWSQEKYDEAHGDGYEEAKQEHAVHVNCSFCGKPCPIQPNSEAHKIVAELLLTHGWGHTSCANRADYEAKAGSRALDDVLAGKYGS